jgi:4-hydroxy 2-oxovalerate aldolase
MAFCREVKALGYKVFFQLASITGYSDEELLEVSRLTNDVKPYALSIVDTYGLMEPEELKHVAGILDAGLDPDITLGFHAHNNLQLGYINTATVLALETERDLLVDGSLYGMGKSAGNAPLELVALYMNEHCGKRYEITRMQEAIVTSVMDFQRITPWGYQLTYYIAAANRVHPNYVRYLMDERTLPVTAINEILQRIPDDQKLEKNRQLIEQLYADWRKEACDDAERIVKGDYET